MTSIEQWVIYADFMNEVYQAMGDLSRYYEGSLLWSNEQSLGKLYFVILNALHFCS